MSNEHRRFKDAIYEQLARVGKALSAPKRLELLELLDADCELRGFLALRQHGNGRGEQEAGCRQHRTDAPRGNEKTVEDHPDLHSLPAAGRERGLGPRVAQNWDEKKLQAPRHRLKMKAPGPRYAEPGALPPANPVARDRAYCTTVTARRFCDQHEISLQMATGRSLPNDFDVTRPGFTPFETR